MQDIKDTYARMRAYCLNLTGDEREEFWFAVYEKLRDNSTPSEFPSGVEEYDFARYIVKLKAQGGGTFQPGTIMEMIEKIANAYEETIRDRYSRIRQKKDAQ